MAPHAGTSAAAAFVWTEDVADNIPCRPEPGPMVEAVDAFRTAGFTDIALCQSGGEHQDGFLKVAERTLLPAR
ncbi:MAG: hypothetical protein WCA46_18135 [Actinocatenispora sp.]